MRIFGIIGGCREKADLVEALVAELGRRGVSVSTMRRVQEDFDLDRPGKGSFRQREAGAREVLLASSFRWALLHEERTDFAEPDVDLLLRGLAPVDIVIADGFRASPYPKLEIVVPDSDRRLQAEDDLTVIALAAPSAEAALRRCLDVAEIGPIADLVLARALPAGAGLVEAAA